MADYKEMYLKMARASEQAVNILIKAQRECEELYISVSDPELVVFSSQENTSEPGDQPCVGGLDQSVQNQET